MGNIRQFVALLWKALCSRKYHYIATFFNIVLPILLGFVAIKVNSEYRKDVTQNATISELQHKQTIFQEFSASFYGEDIPYIPDTEDVNNLMNNVKKILRFEGTFLPMKSEDEMENWLYKRTKNHSNEFFMGTECYGIVFHNLNNNLLNYSIRDTNPKRWRTNQIFPKDQTPGPMDETSYFSYGFLALQIAIDEAFMEMKQLNKPVQWTLQRFPYPEYKMVGDFQLIYSTVLPLVILIGYIFTVVSLVISVAEEKECGMRIRLKLAGAKSWTIYAAWIVDYTIVALFTAAILTILFFVPISKAGAIFQKSSFLIIWITIFLYYLITIFCVIALSNVFTRARYAILFALSISFMSYWLMGKFKTQLTSAAIFFCSIIPNGFLILSMEQIILLEVLGDGATWSNMYTAIGSLNNSLSYGIIWLAALLGILIYYALILHLDAVFPGPYGVAKPWYWFISQKHIGKVCPTKKNRSSFFEDKDVIDKTSTQKSLTSVERENIKIEPVVGDPLVAIQISHLSKKYGTLSALNNFSLDIYGNQITALLGHNGAGKTTLLSIITGMIPATSGDVYVDDNNILQNFELFRRDLGYCPQSDLLLPSLTVSEHIIFFGMLKGFSKRQATVQCEEILLKCVLTHKKNARVAKLSGGLKRRLCLAISLVNDPKFLVLDEPTSGLDPESRRTIWDILLEVRRDCTILISTHFMEEADILGERIAIMSHGELKCYGSSLFLKKIYGSGYHITILLSPETTLENVEKIVSIVKNHVPEAAVVHESTESIYIKFPLTAVEHFPSLFGELEASDQLGVTGLTVSCTTIDDVFQKVHEEEGVKFHVDEVDLPSTYSRLESRDFGSYLMKIGSLIIAFMNKRLLWIYRNSIISLIYIFLPLFFIITPARNMGSSEDVVIKPLLLNLKMYGSTLVYMENDRTKYSESFKYQIEEQESKIILTKGSQTIVDALLNFGREDVAKYRTSLIVSGNMSEEVPNVLYSSIGIHSPAIAVNLLTNSLINPKSGNSLPNRIYTYNHPYAFKTDACSNNEDEMAIVIAYVVMILIAMSTLLSYFTILPHIERKIQFKEIQLLSNLQYPIYWLLTFLIDFIIYFFVAVLIVSCMVIFDSSEMMRDFSIAGNMLLILLLYGLSTIWCVYTFSFLFNTYNAASSLFLTCSLTLNIVGIVIINIHHKNWKYVFYLNPITPLTMASYHLISLAKYFASCKVCPDVVNEVKCSDTFKTNILQVHDFTTELIYLGLDWILYLVIIFLIDSGLVAFVWNLIKSLIIGPIDFSEMPSDPDVLQEKAKIRDLENQPDDEKPVLVVDGLAKKFSRKVTAVKDVSFAVTEGQCFGLLGTNGAGKSTTFQMIATYIIPTLGDAEIYGFSLKKNKAKYKAQIGYCPQSEGLLLDLTAKETLQFFARIRGIPGKQINQQVDKWINLLGLTEYQNRRASTYSGGNIRKLSTAVALLGNPPVVFLDEPTTGVDPVTRRKIWQILKLMQHNNQTIVITSHSMDECEALCDRLTIMVKGTMRCIGNIQYLKKVHGKGYTILIKLGSISNDELQELKEKVKLIFSNNCVLWNEYKGLLHYHLEDTTQPWSSLFQNMADLKEEFSGIDDYVLSDASLEQVFLSFAAPTAETTTTTR